MATYRWGTYRGKVSAQVAGERLAQLAAENDDRLTPRIVLEDSRPVDAPLHKCFEWDDVRAAELHREDQARAIIRGVRVVTTAQSEGHAEELQRVFVNIVEQAGEDLEHSYIPTAVVRKSDDLRRQVLQAARRDFAAWQSRYMDVARAVNAEVVVEKLDALVEEADAQRAQPAA